MSETFICESQGHPLRSEQDALDLIGEAAYRRVQWVVVPAERLHQDFWRLSTRVAGEFVGKFANYRRGLVVMGDISEHIAASSSFRDWVREANRGRQIWFVADQAELEQRLAGNEDE
ncbi:DUF4180 domain-containing protein [Nonomuraea sp. NPDC049714]|jgi:hypothetical protein|uniref:DUF4180 domain-containing protein n=1 Tax=Nonomuraea sp. NPDC049714 TaxID=3364357 RepID=UPI0037993910